MREVSFFSDIGYEYIFDMNEFKETRLLELLLCFRSQFNKGALDE